MNKIDKNNEITEMRIKVGEETLYLKTENNFLEQEIVETKVEAMENTLAVFVKGEKKLQEPFFGPQEYWEPKKGCCYSMEITNVEKILAIYQHKSWWIRPCFPKELKEIPEKTQLLLIKKGEVYLAIVAVCGKECRTDMKGNENSIFIEMTSNCRNRKKLEDLSIVIAYGKNPYQCCEDAVKRALKLTGKTAMFRTNRKYPDMFEYLGWCSWDAFYHNVSEEGICEKLKELNDKKMPVKWVLIDDGWLDADYKTQVLKGLDADSEKFPNGLGGCVKKIKEDFCIPAVGVWHAVMGYWNGLEKGSSAEEQMKEGIKYLEDGRIIPDAQSGRAFMFYQKWHEYLKEHCGIDFVKVDGQSAISIFYSGEKSYGAASREIQKGLNASAALYFDNAIINCMGMASEDMWNRPSSAVSRSSDDFVPEVSHGFREHVIQNSYNSLLQGQFYWGDWDMFWSNHKENWNNSILRAVSGGPVYTSDKVGQTNPSYIMPLIRKSGKVIRCQDVAMPTMDSLFEDSAKTGRTLKVFNRYKNCFVIAAFGIAEDGEGNCKISRTDIPEMEEKRWYVYHYRNKNVSLLEENPYICNVGNDDGELFVIFPDKPIQIMGILEKYIGLGCVENIVEESNRTIVFLTEGGTLGFLSDRQPALVHCNGEAVLAERKPVQGEDCKKKNFYQVMCSENEQGKCVIEIFW